jgi:hypothetical protein
MHRTCDLHIVLSHLWAVGGTRTRKPLHHSRQGSAGVYAQVSLSVTCSAAVHGCQLVMIRAAAPNLLQVRAGRRIRIALLPDNAEH